MTTIDSFPSALAAIDDLRIEHGAGLLDHTRAQLRNIATKASPLDRVVGTVEALWAARADIGKPGRDTAAALALFVGGAGFPALALEGRGQRIAAALHRAGGYSPPAGTDWPDPETDPETLAEYVADEADTSDG